MSTQYSYNVFSSDEHQLAIAWKQRAGCTTIKRWWANLIGLSGANEMGIGELHNCMGYAENSEWWCPIHRLDYKKDFYVFTRHPWDRLVSAFLNKFIQQDLLYIDRNCVYQEDFKNWCFLDFVRAVCRYDPYALDAHYQPQVLGWDLNTRTSGDTVIIPLEDPLAVRDFARYYGTPWPKVENAMAYFGVNESQLWDYTVEHLQQRCKHKNGKVPFPSYFYHPDAYRLLSLSFHKDFRQLGY